MTRRSYAPYSKLAVGAAGLSPDGRVFVGCNVENASYGMTLCAECGLISDLVAGGGGSLIALSVRGGEGQYLTPCGRCRQLLIEHGSVGLLVDRGPDCQPWLLADLIPDGFTEADLPATKSG